MGKSKHSKRKPLAGTTYTHEADGMICIREYEDGVEDETYVISPPSTFTFDYVDFLFWIGNHIQDRPDGTPARRLYRRDGSIFREDHYLECRLQDLLDGTPAVRTYYEDGSIDVEDHYQHGLLQDPPDGSPAEQWHYPNGATRHEAHYRAGRPCNGPNGAPAVREYAKDGTATYEARLMA
jgi:hypothetical protein